MHSKLLTTISLAALTQKSSAFFQDEMFNDLLKLGGGLIESVGVAAQGKKLRLSGLHLEDCPSDQEKY